MLETLYLQLQNKSVKYIVVVEPVGISIETGSLINLGEFDVPSIALTCNNVNQHNYIGALRKANYNILKSSLVNIPYQKYKHLLLVVASLED